MINCVNLCVKSWGNFVNIFVDFFKNSFPINFSTTLFNHFKHLLHPLFNSLRFPVIIKTFPLFHKAYNNNYYINKLIIK